MKSNNTIHRYNSALELIANPENPTPLVRLNRVVPKDGPELYLKLEWYNPFGSIKDRTALYLLKGMEERGELEGKELVEATSGNTGIALAAIASIMKKKLTVTIPDAIPEEKKILLRMLGADVWSTPDDLCPIDHPKDGAIALAHSFIQSENGKDRYAMPNQYENHDNVKAHYETTGPEIWSQTEGQVKVFFAGLGTCGTLTGIGRFLKEKNPEIKVIAIEPQKGHRLPGMKNLEESKTPAILDRSVIDSIIRVDDEQAYAMTKRLFREEGLIVGPSTGAIVHAAEEYNRKRFKTVQNKGKNDNVETGLKPVSTVTVAISPDGGFKYASFFADIIGEEGKPEVETSVNDSVSGLY